MLTGRLSQLTDSGSAPSLPLSDVVALFQNSNTTEISTTFARVAQCLTVFYRNATSALDPESDVGPAQALGVIWEDQIIVMVRWAWLTSPCALLALTVLSLGLTFAGSMRGECGFRSRIRLRFYFIGCGARVGKKALGMWQTWSTGRGKC